MSAQGNTNSEANAVQELSERFEKKDKIIALANDDQEAFVSFVGNIGADNFKDWSANAPKEFTGLALVYASNKDDVKTSRRLIAIPSKEAVFADEVAKANLYRMYVSRFVNSAMDDEANPANFVTVAGCFKQKFDLDAFKFQAKSLVKLLKEKVKLLGVTTVSLRQAFMSSAFATTQFPRIKSDAWDTIIGLAKATAEKHGYDVSIFDHWIATRAVQSADTSEIEFDFASMAGDLETAVEDKDEETPAAPAA